MTEKVSFTLYLKDLVSPAAKRAGAALEMFSGKRGLNGAEEALGRFGKTQARVSGANGHFVESMATAQRSSESFLGSMLKFEAIKAAGRAVVGFGAGMLESAVFTDQLTNAFDQLNHGKGAETLQHTRRMAEEFGLAVHDTAKSYKTFLAMQFTTGTADKLIAMGADMQALGADAEEVRSIFRAIGQIKGKGVVQMEELSQQLGEKISVDLVLKELQSSLGKDSTMDVRKMISAGQVNADQGIEAIFGAVNKKLGQSELGETGKKYAQNTLGGAIGVFKAQATNMWDALAAGSAMNGLKTTVKTTGEQLVGFLMSEEGATAIRGVTSAVQGLFSAASKSVPWIFKGFKGAVGVFEWAGEHAIPLATSALVLFAPALASSAVAGFAAAAGWMAATGPLLLLAGAAGLFAHVWEQASNTDWAYLWEDIKSGALGLWNSIKRTGAEIATWAVGIGASIVDGVVRGIQEAMGSAVAIAQQMGQSLIGAARSVLGIHSPSKEFEAIGGYTGEGFTEGFAQSMLPANDVLPAFSRRHKGGAELAMFSEPEPMPGDRVSMPDFSGLARGGIGGGFVFNLHVNVNASSNEPDEIAEETADVIEERLEDIFARWADESAA